MAASVIILGFGVAGSKGHIDLVLLVLALATAMLLQIVSNLANDYGDAVKGVDTMERRGPLRLTTAGLITAPTMRKAIWLCSACTLMVGLTLVVYATWGKVILLTGFIVLGLLCLVAALAYTLGKVPYGYKGYGDIMAGIFFGPVPVLGYVLLSGAPVNKGVWLAGIAAGLCSTAVLNINNLRDISTDAKTGKRTIAVALGHKRASFYHAGLTLGIVLCWAVFVLYHKVPFALALLIPLVYSSWNVIRYHNEAPCLNKQLRITVLSSALCNICMGLIVLWKG